MYPCAATSSIASVTMPQSARAPGTETADTVRLAHVVYKAAHEAGLHPQKEKVGLLQSRSASDGLPQRASVDRPADVWIPHQTVTSRLRPASRSPGPTTTAIQNLTDYETVKRTFHDTANRCHQNGLRFAPKDTRGAGETPHAPWSPGSPNDSAPPFSHTERR